MNPYNQKPRRGQIVVNAILITLAAVAAAGAVTLAVTQRKQIAENVNGMLGDNEKVTFTQIIKKEAYGLHSGSNVRWNATLKDGVFSLDNTAGTASLPVNKDTVYSNIFFETASHDMNGYAIYYFSLKALSTKVLGSKAGLMLCNQPLDAKPAELNVWTMASSCVVNSSGYASYYLQGTNAAAGDLLKFGDFQIVNVSSLGLWDTSEACAVFDKLTKGEYFEGDKTFTKGEIKKAIADYEAEQKALASSAAAVAASSVAATTSAAA